MKSAKPYSVVSPYFVSTIARMNDATVAMNATVERVFRVFVISSDFIRLAAKRGKLPQFGLARPMHGLRKGRSFGFFCRIDVICPKLPILA